MSGLVLAVIALGYALVGLVAVWGAVIRRPRQTALDAPARPGRRLRAELDRHPEETP